MLVDVIVPLLPADGRDKFMANFSRLADPYHSCEFDHSSPSSAYCSGGHGSESSPELKRDAPLTATSPMRSPPICRKLDFTSSPTTPQTKCSTATPCTPAISVCPPKHECPRCKTVKVTNYLRLCPDCVTSNASILPGISMVECGHCSHRVLCQQSPGKGSVVSGPVGAAKKTDCGQCDKRSNVPESPNYNLSSLFKSPKPSVTESHCYNLSSLFKTESTSVPKSSKPVPESPNYNLSPLFKLDSSPEPKSPIPSAPILSPEARNDLMMQELFNKKARLRSPSDDTSSTCSQHDLGFLLDVFATPKKSSTDKKVTFTADKSVPEEPLISFATPPSSSKSFSGSEHSRTTPAGGKKLPESLIYDLLCRSVNKAQALSVVEEWFADKEATLATITSAKSSVDKSEEVVNVQLKKDAEASNSSEASKSEASKSEASKSEASKSEASKSEASKSEASKSEASKSEASKSEASKSEASKSEASKPSEAPKSSASTKSSGPSKPPKKPCEKCSKCRKKIHSMERVCESNTLRKTNSMQSLSDFSDHLSIPAPEILINLPQTPVKRRPTKRDISSGILVKVKIFENLPVGVFKALQSDPKSPLAKQAMKNLKLSGQVMSPVKLAPPTTEQSTVDKFDDNASSVNSSVFSSCYSDVDTLLECSR